MGKKGSNDQKEACKGQNGRDKGVARDGQRGIEEFW
jgi:hypothetical protein